MNILQITLGFYPAQAWGGPVKIVHQNSRELVRRGHSVTVHCSNLMNKKERIKPNTFEDTLDGIRIIYFKAWNFVNWPGTLGPMWLPGYAKYIKKEIKMYDIVHINGYRCPFMLSAAKAAKRAGVPIITQPHGALPIITNSKIIKRFYDLFAGNEELDGISALIALQESEKKQALDRGVSEERIVIIPNGINPEDRRQIPKKGSFRNRIGLKDNKPIILFLGRINKNKGTDMLIEAFAHMEDKNTILAVVGPDDGQLDEIKMLIRRFDLERRVLMTGLLTGNDVYGAFQDAELFVLPCRYDTFPVTVMEACLVGTPMVITDRCEIAYIVHNRVAEVVPFDSYQFANAMKRLLTNKELYENYRRNCKSVFNEHFSIEGVVNKLETLYRRAVKERSGT